MAVISRMIMNDYESLYCESIRNEKMSSPCYLVSYRPLTKENSFISIDTMWVGFDNKREIRKASLVDPIKTKTLFKILNYPLASIQNLSELTSFLRIGGHALIEENIIKSNWEDLLNPKIVIESYEEGYIDYDTIKEKYKSRFPRGNFRIELFNRDNYQCRICGTSPDDGVHVRLEIHHIKPWEEGGISTPKNLITLCATCHDGASQINREVLYNKIGLQFPFVEHKFFKENPDWSATQILYHSQIIHNAVTLKIKTSS